MGHRLRFAFSTGIPALLAVLVAGAAFGASVPAQDAQPSEGSAQPAILPYAVLYQQLAVFESVAHLKLVYPELSIRSINSEVAPGDIEILLETEQETLRFKADEQGHFDFPFRGDWADEGRLLVANQPAGSLQLNVSYAARRLKATRLPYVALMACAPEFAEALTAQARMSGAPEPRVKGLLLRFTGSEPGQLTVHAAQGDQVFRAGEDGVLALATDAGLWRENPEISLSSPLESILPWQESPEG